MENNFYQKHYLSTDAYYFKYRHDNNNPEVVRATLYNLQDKRVDDIRKTEGYGLPEKSHNDIINYFEARLLIGAIK